MADIREEVDLKKEERSIQLSGLVAMIICGVFFPAGYYILPAWISFPTALVERLAFALQASWFVLLCVLVGVGMVSVGRRQSVDDIGGSAGGAPSPGLAIRSAFLQNTLEQAFLAVGVYLILATLLSGPWLSLIIVAVFLFVAGRILFYLGYRQVPHAARGRAFGMTLTMLPTILGYILALILLIRSW